MPGVAPVGRMEAAFAREPESGRFVLFGGRSNTVYYGDLWTLSTLDLRQRMTQRRDREDYRI